MSELVDRITSAIDGSEPPKSENQAELEETGSVENESGLVQND
jgi:hypothetical protein